MNEQFKRIEPADRERLAPYLSQFPFIDTGFAGLYYIAEAFDVRFGFVEGAFCLRMTYDGGEKVYAMPSMENLQKTAEALAEMENGVVTFDYVSAERLNAFKALSGFECEAGFNDIYSDYFCEYADFVELNKAVSLHKYKDYQQFCKRFKSEVTELTAKNLDVAKGILDEWCARRDCEKCVYGCEKKWLMRLFDAWNELGVKGIFVCVDGQPVAFNTAEQNGDILLKLAAKSIGGQVGLNVFMGVEAARRLFPSAKFVNLGPDSGVDGLKRYKEKFLPYIKLDKYQVRLKKR